MKMFFKNYFCRKKDINSFDLSNSFVGYTIQEKIKIIDKFNCYGIDAILKYLNS